MPAAPLWVLAAASVAPLPPWRPVHLRLARSLSSRLPQAPLFHWASLTNHKCKGKIIKNFRVATAECETTHGPFKSGARRNCTGHTDERPAMGSGPWHLLPPAEPYRQGHPWLRTHCSLFYLVNILVFTSQCCGSLRQKKKSPTTVN